jgi:dephospho-CoA kinase
MKLIGLTGKKIKKLKKKGGISTGKSTVSKIIKDKYKIKIIDLDEITNEVYNEKHSSKALKIIKTEFKQCMNEKGEFDRKIFSQYIFTNPTERNKLNKIMKPIIQKELIKKIIMEFIKGEKLVIIDAPLLYEMKMEKYLSKVIVVYCNKEMELKRLIKRDNIEEELATLVKILKLKKNRKSNHKWI